MCTDFAAQVGRKALWHPVYFFQENFRVFLESYIFLNQSTAFLSNFNLR